MTDQTELGDYEKFVRPQWSEEEAANFAVVAQFMSNVRGGETEALASKYRNHPYLQHNPGMKTGIEGVIDEVQQAAVAAPEFFVDTKHAYVDGEYVIFQAHFTVLEDHRGDDRNGFNAIDVWKVVDGKIVEHWDAIQPLDSSPRKNGNGIF